MLCVWVNYDIIESDYGLSPDGRQAIIWNNAGSSSIEHLGTNFGEIIIIYSDIQTKKWVWKCHLLNVGHVVLV